MPLLRSLAYLSGNMAINMAPRWGFRAQPNGAKRMECVQLAGAFGPPTAHESGSKLHALHTLREAAAACKILESCEQVGRLHCRSRPEKGFCLVAIAGLLLGAMVIDAEAAE